MNLKQKYLLIFVFLGLSTQVFSQDSKEILKLSVADAQVFALQNNRSVQSAKIDVSSAEKKVWETIATGLPQLNFAANYQHRKRNGQIQRRKDYPLRQRTESGIALPLFRRDCRSDQQPQQFH